MLCTVFCLVKNIVYLTMKDNHTVGNKVTSYT